jgi:hypothetical protein
VNTLVRMCGIIDPEHTYDECLVLLAKSGMTIVNQIQASIISEDIGKLGRYK